MGDLKIIGTGGIIEGNLGAANIDVKLDSALDFDGSNDIVDLNYGSGVNAQAGFSVAFWVKLDDSFTGSPNQMFIGSSSGTNQRFYIGTDGYRFSFGYASSGWSESGSQTAFAGTWNHVCVTATSGAQKLYVNGVEITAQAKTDSSTFTLASDLGAGAMFGGAYHSNSTMADIKIFGDVLTPAEVQELGSKINYDISRGSIDNLTRWFKSNAGSGATIADDSGNTGTAADISGATWVFDQYIANIQDNTTTTTGNFKVTQGKVEGKALSCVDLDGSAEYIYVGDNNGLSFGDGSDDSPFTISAWIRADANNFPIISKGHYNSGVGEYAFYINSSGYLALELWDESVASCYVGQRYETAITLNQWIHVAATYSAPAGGGAGATDGVKLYIDGVLVSSADYEGNAASYDAMENLGSNAWIGRLDNTYANGEIRDVRIYDYELSADQASSLYSGSYNVVPYLWWKIDEGHTTEADVDASNAFTDTGTKGSLGTNQFNRLDGTGTNLDASSCQNGTLNLDNSGALTIQTNGIFSAPRGKCQVAGDITGGGKIIHNNGTFESDRGSSTVNIDFSGTGVDASGNAQEMFYDVLCTNATTKIVRDTSIARELHIDSSGTFKFNCNSRVVTLTMGTSSSSGEIHQDGGGFQFENNTSNAAKIVAADTSGLNPWTNVSGYNIDWDSGGSGSLIELAHGNYNGNTATGGGGANIKLTGDMEFDGFEVNSGDELNLNGQRAEFSGVFNVTGSDADLKSTGGGLIVGHNNVTISGSAEQMHDGDVNMIVTAGTGHDWRLGYGDGANPWCRNVLINGNITHTDQLGPWSGSSGGNASAYNPESVIVGNGKWTQSGGHAYLKNLTIAAGGELEMTHGSQKEIHLHGDFTTSGGLLGASCLSLDRDNTEYARSVNHADLDLFNGRNAMTAEMWFKTSYTGSNHQHMMNVKDNDGSPQVMQMFIDYSTGKINARIFTSGTTSTQIGASDVRDGKWHHVAIVYDGDTGKHSLYVDGKLEAEETGSGEVYAATDAEFNIGVRYSLDQGYFHGEIDEVRLFAAAKTAAQIRADMFVAEGTNLTHFNSQANGSTDGLVGRWGCNDGSGSTLTCSNTNLNMTIKDHAAGPAAYSDAWAGAGTFTYGTSELKMVAASTKINYTGDLSVYKLTIATGGDSNVVTMNEINGNNGGVVVYHTLEQLSGKLASTTSEYIQIGRTFGNVLVASGKGAIAFADVYKIFIFQNSTSGTMNFPSSSSADKNITTKRLFITSSSSIEAMIQGDLTLTEELEVSGGNTFNANEKTINAYIVDIDSGGVLNLTDSSLLFNVSSTNDSLDLHSGATLITGNTTITGFDTPSNKHTWSGFYGGGFEVVGDVSNLNIAAGELTVIGSVSNCTGTPIKQFSHTLDTQQLLDADELGTDDLKLDSPPLDNSLELQTN